MIARYTELIEHEIRTLNLPSQPDNLYSPIGYFLGLGGKRMRPVMCLMTAEMYGNMEQAIGAAMGIELFHNFTLIHDDIMDDAPLRRNMPTIHSKWNRDVAILSGDTTFVLAMQQVLSSQNEYLPHLLKVFLKTAAEVCEGQQMDMDFQLKEQITAAEYLEMIRLKTAVLLGCSMKMGAIAAGAPVEEAVKCYHFGESLGLAFQMRDDYLDLFGNPEIFGKTQGGDILAGKKTLMVIHAFQKCNSKDAEILKAALYDKSMPDEQRIENAKKIIKDCGSDVYLHHEIDKNVETTFRVLNEINADNKVLENLRALTNQLLTREA
jgi:geranylgeranyl diphosphate synthase type II